MESKTAAYTCIVLLRELQINLCKQFIFESFFISYKIHHLFSEHQLQHHVETKGIDRNRFVGMHCMALHVNPENI